MIKIYESKSASQTILRRIPLDDLPIPVSIQQGILDLFGEPLSPQQVVDRILTDVRLNGDRAVKAWSARLDGSTVDNLHVNPAEVQAALSQVSQVQIDALKLSIERVRKFHEKQPLTSWITQSLGGTLGQVIRPIERIGLYIPAGTAPLPSSLIMSAVPAQVAGVPEIVLVAPPNRQTGKIAPIILATAALLGLSEIYILGGAQAIAAIAYGTETIRKVDKIFGPGNLFVTLAKRQVYGLTGIDSLAGPTETVVIADDTANPAWVAADLLAQAEHDMLAAAILLTPSRPLAVAVQAEVARQIQERTRRGIMEISLTNRSGIVITRDLDEAVSLANQYAPEHLCLAVKDPWSLSEKVTAAGGIFIGEHSFEVLGDYIAGPSHVMPTGGSARFASPLNVLDFIHIISLVALDPATTRAIAPSATTLALAEGLDAHAYAAQVRL
ncbi:MAG TPA: histidinol dehydrogenase [Anaerolineaceae bacterium]